MDRVYAEEMFYNEDYTRSVVLIKQCFFSYHFFIKGNAHTSETDMD